MRYDLAFFLCCCKSFLGEDPEGNDDFYTLLGVDRDASPDEIKKAYKRKSLQMHPDKLAQKGLTVTEESQALFTRMKEAYEVRSPMGRTLVGVLLADRFWCHFTDGNIVLSRTNTLDQQPLTNHFIVSHGST